MMKNTQSIGPDPVAALESHIERLSGVLTSVICDLAAHHVISQDLVVALTTELRYAKREAAAIRVAGRNFGL